jgi:hypothetical protein
MESFLWIGIGICITQSAMFSGLNLAFFSLSRLRLEAEVAQKNRTAEKVLRARKDANFLLTTILWGNVGINVLLTLLSGSVMAGVAAFFFSTFVITLLGEIIPQAYFSRNALRMASWLLPVLRFYQVLLFPLAKTSALALDRWLGKEAVPYFRERDLEEIIKMHVLASESEIDRVEGRGALNFLALDDLPVRLEGEPVNPESIVELEFRNGKPMFPEIEPSNTDPFLDRILSAGTKWSILVDRSGEPGMVVNADSFLRDALFGPRPFNPYAHCHRPVVIKDSKAALGDAIARLKVIPERTGDDVIDEDVILYWADEKRVITGSDILGRLLRGIAQQEGPLFRKPEISTA